MDPRYEFLIPQEAEAVLLVEFHGDSADEVQGKLAEVVAAVQVPSEAGLRLVRRSGLARS